MNRIRLGLGLLLATTALPALAADPDSLDKRVERVEKQLKAVQRKVFPGGSPAFFEPEIAPPAPQATVGTPASAPLNDLTARVDALEKSVADLTGKVEQDEHRLSLLSEQAAKDRHEFEERLTKLETPPAPVVSEAALAPPAAEADDEAPAPIKPPKSGPAKAAPAPAKPGAAKPAATKAPAAAPTDDEGGASGSDDPGEAAYMAGYRLWSEKKYPQAEAALKAFVAKYPKHRRASYAQNLLGRAYLDDGQPGTAAQAFAANYQTNPRGERAPDSLYYLGQSLMKLDKPADACRVYGEMDAAYGDKLSDSLKARVATARKEAKCK